jgi:hypothetical protein
MEPRGQSPSLVSNLGGELDAFLPQFGYRRVNVLTSQIELMPRFRIRRVRGQLRGREREDQPTTTCIHEIEAERVAEEGARTFRVLREDDRVNARNHGLKAYAV